MGEGRGEGLSVQTVVHYVTLNNLLYWNSLTNAGKMIQNQALRWRPTVLIRITLLLHAALLVAVVIVPNAWPWILATFCANHLALTVVGMWPRSTWLGPNWTRLPPACAARGEIALTIDDGPHPEVTPQVLALLDRHGIKASFF